MAEDSERSGMEHEPKMNGREHHRPQHASATHERQPSKETPMEMEEDAPAASGARTQQMDGGPHHRLWRWITSHKKVSIPAAVILVLAVLAAIPLTRYALVGTVLRKDFSVVVTDSQTNKPVSSAAVTLEGKTVTTNNQGVAKIHANVGNATLAVSKKYYKAASQSVLVPIGKQKQPEHVSLVATGRQVPVVVVNYVTGKPVANATVSAQGTEAKTDSKGEVTIVLPADKATAAATVGGNGYNTAKVTIVVTTAAYAGNTFKLTPSGKLYFLSNKSGNIDVVKTNLDGTDRQTVLAGTGKEDRFSTVLLASQDWHYLALQSKRDGTDKLFLIDTTSGDAVTTMDEGDADFGIVGWSGHRFVYTVTRANVELWQANRQALKAFDAPSGKTTTLDQSAAAGHDGAYFGEYIGSVYIYSDEIVYAKNVQATSSSDISGHQSSLNSVNPDGSNKHAIKGWSFSSPFTYYNYVSLDINSRAYGPNQVYATSTSSPSYTPDNNLYDYEDGQLKTVSGKTASNLYDRDYPTYLLSPSDSKTFWSEARDGKNTLLVGDASGKNGKEIATLSDYTPYGWFTENYLLVSNGGSELYIMPVSGGTALKITDYYRPGISINGYGKGYGGL